MPRWRSSAALWRVSSQATASTSASTWIARRRQVGQVADRRGDHVQRAGRILLRAGGGGARPGDEARVSEAAMARCVPTVDRRPRQRGDAAEARGAGASAARRACAGAAQLSGRARPARARRRDRPDLRERDGTLVFVEVRARADAAHGGAAASVGAAKQRAPGLRGAPLPAAPAAPPPCRFDVVAIDGERIEWLRARLRRRLTTRPRAPAVNRGAGTRVISSPAPCLNNASSSSSSTAPT